MAALTTAAIIGAAGIGAASGLGSAAIQGAWQQKLNDQQYAFNAREAARQREFEKEMSSTAYQRAVKDMEKAGLNPASLSGSAGGASTPTGAAASGYAGNAPSVNLGAGLSGLSTALIFKAASDKQFAQKLAIAEKAGLVNEAKANLYNAAVQVKVLKADSLAKQAALDKDFDIPIERL